MIHVYGVVEELEELPPVRGLGDAPLERRRVDGLEVVLSRGDEPVSAEVSREDVLRHAEVVEELRGRSRAVLPAQLGRAFESDDELDAALRAQARQLARGLERVRGCVEFGLRIVMTERPPRPAGDSGADYMHARLEEVREQDRLVERLHEPLARLAREATLRRSAEGIEAAYLVPEEDAAAFRDAAARVEASPDATVVCTGPWPPYSFASAEGAA